MSLVHNDKSPYSDPATQNSGASPKSPRKKWLIPAIIAVVLVACVLIFDVLPRIREERALTANANKVAAAIKQVLYVTPIPAPTAELTLPGSTEAIADTIVAARTTGYVRKMYVGIGDRVKAGQLLAEIEAPDVDASLQQAGQQTLQAQAGVGEAESDVANKRATVAQFRSNVRQAEANVEQAEALEADAEAKKAQAVAQVGSAVAQLLEQEHVVEIKRAALLQANSQLHLADVTLTRYRTLLKDGYVALEDVDQNQALQVTAQAAVNSAQADLRGAQAGVVSAQNLVASGRSNVTAAQTEIVAAKKNVVAVVATVGAAKATVGAGVANVHLSESSVVANLRAVSGARANAERFRVERGFSRVVAPFDGVITARNVDVGALITAGAGSGGSTPPTSLASTSVTGSAATTDATPSTTPVGGLFGLAKTDTLRVLISVPQTFAMQIHPGLQVTLLIAEMPHSTFKGVVGNVSGAIDTVSRTRLTEVRVDNRTGRLLPGMYVQVHFSLPSTGGGMLIPTNALIYDALGTRVQTVTAANKIHGVPIMVGRDFDMQIEATTGLTAGQRVVTNPTDDLVEGMQVQAKETPAAPAPAVPAGTAPPKSNPVAANVGAANPATSTKPIVANGVGKSDGRAVE